MDSEKAMHSEIRRLRERSGLSVIQVSEALDLARSTVYAWEDPNQRNRPDPKHLGRFLETVHASEEEQLALFRLLAGLGPDPQTATAA
jgi:DNA-binding transcriptional regulator YiaG